MEPSQLSAAGHKLGQESHPKCPLEVPVGFSITESEVEVLPSAHRAPSVLLSSGFFSQWEHPPFFLDAQRAVRVFRGWEDQKSLLFLESKGMTR